jgi:hypothetical protein
VLRSIGKIKNLYMGVNHGECRKKTKEEDQQA